MSDEMSTVAFLDTVNGRDTELACNCDYLASVGDGCICFSCIAPIFFLSAAAQSGNCA